MTTYGHVFAFASSLPRIKMVLNSDISLGSGVGLLAKAVTSATVFALSRYEPKPHACLSQSKVDTRDFGHDNFNQQCWNYIGSHDAFVFSMRLPTQLLQNLLPVAPQFLGSENVVIAEMSRIPDVQLGNPCYQVRLFHQHCTGKRSKSRAHMTRINDDIKNFGNMNVRPTVITVLRRRRSKSG